jgi:hypothetical protein
MSALETYTAAQPRYMNDAYIPLLKNQQRYVVLRGGGGSGKSVWAAQKLAMRLTSEDHHRLLVVRKVKDTLRQSVYEQLLEVLRSWDMLDDITTTTSPLSIKCSTTGSEILFAGIDDPEKIKSITRITSIWIEEATELDLVDFTQLDIRLRGKTTYYKQFILTFNPVDEGHWLKKRFFDTPDPRATLLLTTFQDNYFLPEEDRQTLLTLATINANYHRIYVLNEWGRIETGNEFYESFSRAAHVKPTPYLPDKPIMQGWDANALPYSAMLMCQPYAEDGILTLRFFYEYALPPPKSGIRNTGKQFLLDRTAKGWQSSPVFLTGDASLRNRKVGEESGSNFEDVQAALQPALHSHSTRLWPHRNPGVMRRRDFINYVLRGGLPGVRVQIDPGCVKLIEDLEQVQTGVEGKVKKRYNDKALGASYELLGHMSDDFDYILTSLLNAHYEAFANGRDG